MIRKLRVLWLTPAQFPPVTGDASMRGGGWMEGWRWALEAHRPEVELGILGYGSVQHEPITVGNATFFSFKQRARSRYRQLVGRWSHHTPIGEDHRRTVDDVLTAFRPDIVHVHGSESGLGSLFAASGAPVLISLQGFATIAQRFMFSGLSWTDVVGDFGRARFYKGDGYLHSYLSMRDRAVTEQRILSHCRYVLGNTEWDKAIATTLCPSAVYYHADRAVRREFYGGEWTAAPHREPVIYCTGSAAPYKGLEILLEAVSLLRSNGIPDLLVRIAGSVSGGCNWPTLRRVVRRLSLDHAVIWLGEIDALEMVSELERATIFVQPSHIENESNALIEAMLVGTPCVAARVGGIPSIMRDTVDGLLYHDRDPFALAGAIRQLIADPHFVASLGASGRGVAHRRHDPARVADQLVAVYSDVIRKGERVV
jgi:glycosyltransferase involved in cell wall biosynthesis